MCVNELHESESSRGSKDFGMGKGWVGRQGRVRKGEAAMMMVGGGEGEKRGR